MITFTNPLAKIAVNKSLLKEYSNSEYARVVYMKNNSEFQIQIFNPYDYTIGADISINGKRMSNRIIIKPGQRIWLERYLDEARKFLFSTYEIENSVEAKKATRNNGLISISFYKEQVSKPVFSYIPSYIEWTPYNDNIKIGTNSCINHVNRCDTSFGLSSAESSIATTTYINDAITASACTRELSANTTLETGRIEKGSHSNQEFENVYIDFEYWAFSTETIQILPESQKPYTDKDLKKIYCSNCGRKLNTKYKFCPYCGYRIVY
jgi:hypothetical protein